jgi:hypothetical protein
MRRGFLWLTGLIPVIAAAACGSTAGSATLTAGQQGHTYRDRAGWVIEIPPGWHAVRFSDSTDGITAAGVQLSNVKLPPPVLRSGFPIQTSAVLPPRGVGVVIATDTDRTVRSYGPMAVPPLPGFDSRNGWKYWNAGSVSAGFGGAQGGPDIEILRFRAHGTTFTATAKIGPKTTNGDRKAIDAIIQSLR